MPDRGIRCPNVEIDDFDALGAQLLAESSEHMGSGSFQSTVDRREGKRLQGSNGADIENDPGLPLYHGWQHCAEAEEEGIHVGLQEGFKFRRGCLDKGFEEGVPDAVDEGINGAEAVEDFSGDFCNGLGVGAVTGKGIYVGD